MVWLIGNSNFRKEHFYSYSLYSFSWTMKLSWNLKDQFEFYIIHFFWIEIGLNFFNDFDKGCWNILQYEVLSMPSSEANIGFFLFCSMRVNFELINWIFTYLKNYYFLSNSIHWFKACPCKNFNIEKSWNSVVFALIFSEFGYVTEFFCVPNFFYVFWKTKAKMSQFFSMFKFLDGQAFSLLDD